MLPPLWRVFACLCQSIEIDNNKYVYRQSLVRMPIGSVVMWAECLLIIGTAVEFKFLAWSSIAQSICQQAFNLLANRCLRPSGFESCLQQRKTTCLLSIRISLACARASKLTTNMDNYCNLMIMNTVQSTCQYKVPTWFEQECSYNGLAETNRKISYNIAISGNLWTI